MTANERYTAWLNHPDLDFRNRKELEDIKGDAKEIEDRFYKDLNFGTAGLRGILGAGTNRMNVYTVGLAAEAFAEVLAEEGEEAKNQGIAISYDSRHYSFEFADLTARIFRRKGIKVYFSNELRPVPLLSYAIREFNCAGGVMITASHNPKEYNGFKAYGADGSQLDPERAEKIQEKMKEIVDLPANIKDLPTLTPKEDPDIVFFGHDLDVSYHDYIYELSLDFDAIKRHKDMAIVYTPLYGTGYRPVIRALATAGFENVIPVGDQSAPNGDFPTAPYPNPEVREAMDMGIRWCEMVDADLLIATDPDADRLGVAVRKQDRTFELLSGNEIGCLLMDYILKTKTRLNKMEGEHFCVMSVVSSRLARKIAARYHVELQECLTGFKFIAEKIRDGLAAGKHFDFAFEESFGYLLGDKVRDKDAVVAAALLCELAAVAKDEGQNLYERLQDLYADYGYAAEKTVSFTREGKEGLQAIRHAMDVLRRERAENFSELKPSSLDDYLTQETFDFKTKETKALAENPSDLLIYNFAELDRVAIRPSGTEPKLKLYLAAYDADQATAEAKLAQLEELVVRKVEALLNEA